MARDARQHVGPRGVADPAPEADVGGCDLGAFVRREGEGREPEGGGIEPEEKVVHHRVPGDGDLEHVGGVHPGRRRRLGGELVEGLAYRAGHLRRPVLVHHREGDAAHEVLPEPDLRVHPAEGGDDLAGEKVAEVNCEGRRPDVHREPVDPVAVAGPDVDEPPSVAHERRRPVAARLEGRVEPAQGLDLRLDDPRPERFPEALLEAPKVGGGPGEVGGRDLDVHRPHQRVDPDVAGVGPLADDLAVDLARLRHVRHEVPRDAGLAGEAVALLQPAGLALALLPVGRLRQVVRRGDDAVLGELALAHPDLAAGADPAPPAHRIEVDPEAAGGGEERRSGREPAPAPGGGEDDEGVVSHRAGGPGGGAPAPPRPPPRPTPSGGRSTSGSCGRGPS